MVLRRSLQVGSSGGVYGGPVGGLVYGIVIADTRSSIYDLWLWFMRIRQNFKCGRQARVKVDQHR